MEVAPGFRCVGLHLTVHVPGKWSIIISFNLAPDHFRVTGHFRGPTSALTSLSTDSSTPNHRLPDRICGRALDPWLGTGAAGHDGDILMKPDPRWDPVKFPRRHQHPIQPSNCTQHRQHALFPFPSRHACCGVPLGRSGSLGIWQVDTILGLLQAVMLLERQGLCQPARVCLRCQQQSAFKP